MNRGRNTTRLTDPIAAINRVQTLTRQDEAAQAPNGILGMLAAADLELQGLMPWSSNYTFLVTLAAPQVETGVLAIYKPCRGERPLWDFPEGSLGYREFASYLISLALGWPKIPPTVLRDGPHGPGSVQLFVEAEYEAHYFNMREDKVFTERFMEIALFDAIVNNADRKGGHCLKDNQGQIWAIDHGLTFHPNYKLRTVIWDFCNQPIPAPLLASMAHLRQVFSASTGLGETLRPYLAGPELTALQKRLDKLLSAGRFPDLQPGRNVPYPPV